MSTMPVLAIFKNNTDLPCLMRLRITGVMIVLLILLAVNTAAQDTGTISLNVINNKVDTLRDAYVQEANQSLEDIKTLQEMQLKIMKERNPQRKEELRKEMRIMMQDILRTSKERNIVINSERKMVDELIKKNIKLGFDKERIQKTDADFRELQTKIKELNEAESEEEKTRLLGEINEIKSRINLNIPQIKEKIIRQRNDYFAKTEDISRLALKIKDERKRQALEKLKEKNMIKINKVMKLVDILDRETMKETQKTLVTVSVKAERKMFDVDIIEEIPKSYAEDISQVEFSIEPEVLEDDPIVKWNFDSIKEGEEVEVSYWVEGEHEDNTTTIAAEEPYEEKKLSQLIAFVVIACVVFIILALFMTGGEGSNLKKKRKKK